MSDSLLLVAPVALPLLAAGVAILLRHRPAASEVLTLVTLAMGLVLSFALLVIVHVAQEKYSETGAGAKSFENLWLQPGLTADEALAQWKMVPRMFAGLPRSAPYFNAEEYRWIDVGEEIE